MKYQDTFNVGIFKTSIMNFWQICTLVRRSCFLQTVLRMPSLVSTAGGHSPHLHFRGNTKKIFQLNGWGGSLQDVKKG